MSKPNAVFKEAYNRCLALLGQTDSLPSEPDIALALGVSRTTVRSVLGLLRDQGVIAWEGRSKRMLRSPRAGDFFAERETSSVAELIEKRFMQRVLTSGIEAGDQISELEFARDIGVSTSSVREYLIGFSRFGLIEKRRNSQWLFKGFDRQFALELCDVREMFEVRSAQAFASLPADHPAWQALAAIEGEHRDLLAQVGRRYREFSELDERFHRLIHEVSGNRFVIAFYDLIAMIFHYHYQWNKADEAERNQVAITEHLDYIAGLRSRQGADAEFFCRRHLRSARDTLLRSVTTARPHGTAVEAAQAPEVRSSSPLPRSAV